MPYCYKNYSGQQPEARRHINKKLMYIFSAALAVFSIVLLIIGFLTYRYEKNFINNGIETNAVIVSIDSYYEGTGSDVRYTVIVDYEIDGVKYTSELGTYISGMKTGQTVSIYYMPDNPYKINHAGYGYLFALIPAGISLFLITGSVVLFVIGLKSGKMKNLTGE